MAIAAPFQRLVELAQQTLLLLVELDRRLHGDVAIQVTGIARAQAFDAFAAQAEGLAGLRAFGEVDFRLAAQRGHIDAAAQSRLRHAHRNVTVQVVAIALEHRVLLDVDFHIQVSGRPAVDAGFAVARGADAHARVDARGNLHFQGLLLLDAATAMTGRAGLGNELARAVAGRTGLLHGERSHALRHLTAAMAGRAGDGLGAGLGAAAVASAAFFPAGDAQAFVHAVCGIFEADFQ